MQQTCCQEPNGDLVKQHQFATATYATSLIQGHIAIRLPGDVNHFSATEAILVDKQHLSLPRLNKDVPPLAVLLHVAIISGRRAFSKGL